MTWRISEHETYKNALQPNQPLHNTHTVSTYAAARPPDCLSSSLARNANTAHNDNLHTPDPTNLRQAHQQLTRSEAVHSNATSGLLAILKVMLHDASRKALISETGAEK